MRFRRAEDEEYRPELTPLVDVVFQLIIFFMVSTVFVEYSRQVNIELPSSAGKAAPIESSAVTIEIREDQKIFLNGVELTKDKLLDELVKINEGTSVVIRADKRIPYGHVIQLMAVCEEAGITDIRAAVQ